MTVKRFEALGFEIDREFKGEGKILHQCPGAAGLRVLVQSAAAASTSGGSQPIRLNFAAQSSTIASLMEKMTQAGWSVDKSGSQLQLTSAADGVTVQIDSGWDGSIEVEAALDPSVQLSAEEAKLLKKIARRRAKEKSAGGASAADEETGGKLFPVEDETLVVKKRLVHGAHSETGRRESNEDQHLCVPAMKTSADTALFAVFDGHGGAGASAFVAKRLVSILEKQKEFKVGGNRAKALTRTFIKLDEKYVEKYEEDGTTACVLLLLPSLLLYCASVGDSRAYLLRDGKMHQLSFDHKPNDAAERKRIEKAGHEVLRDTVLEHGKRVHTHRIDSVLAVSRSIGDAEYKDCYDRKPAEQAVSCIPEMHTMQAELGDKLLVACDGLWDVCTDEQVAQKTEALFKEGKSVEDISKALCQMALDAGSDDNVSVVIVDIQKD